MRTAYPPMELSGSAPRLPSAWLRALKMECPTASFVFPSRGVQTRIGPEANVILARRVPRAAYMLAATYWRTLARPSTQFRTEHWLGDHTSSQALNRNWQ